MIIGESFTPIPFKFIAIAAGVASMNLLTFTIGHILHFAIVALRVAFWGQLLLQMTRRSMSVGLLGAGSFPQSVAALLTRRGNLVRLYVPQTQVEASAIKRDNVVLHTPRRTQ